MLNYSRRRQSREYSVHPRLSPCMCLCACLSVRTIEPNRLKLQSPNLPQSWLYPFKVRSRSQDHRVQKYFRRSNGWRELHYNELPPSRWILSEWVLLALSGAREPWRRGWPNFGSYGTNTDLCWPKFWIVKLFLWAIIWLILFYC